MQDARRLRFPPPPFLEQHGWPGNIRELRGVVRRAMMLRESARIEPSAIEFEQEPQRAPLGIGRTALFKRLKQWGYTQDDEEKNQGR